MHTVWLGAAGTNTAYCVARSLRDGWGDGVRIVTADIAPAHLVGSAELADLHVRVPPVKDARFEPEMRAALAEHGADTWVPLLIEEIALAARMRPDGVGLLAPAAEVAEMCADKLAAARWMDEHGVPTPPTLPAGEARWWPEGVVIKPRLGQGSQGVTVVEDEQALELARRDADGAIAQRRCRHPEVTVDAFRSRDGGLFRAVCRERIEVKAGVCTKARLFHDEELEGAVRRAAETLDYCGVLCVQAMRGPEGWEVTDLNPRCGAATRMTVLAGVDVIGAALADLWGQDPAPFLGDIEGEPYVVRHYEESIRRAQ
jgi:ATP-grasp domain